MTNTLAFRVHSHSHSHTHTHTHTHNTHTPTHLQFRSHMHSEAAKRSCSSRSRQRPCRQHAAQVGLALCQAAQLQPVLLPDGHRLQAGCLEQPVCSLSLTCRTSGHSTMSRRKLTMTPACVAHIACWPLQQQGYAVLGQQSIRQQEAIVHQHVGVCALYPGCPARCTPPGRLHTVQRLPGAPSPARRCEVIQQVAEETGSKRGRQACLLHPALEGVWEREVCGTWLGLLQQPGLHHVAHSDGWSGVCAEHQRQPLTAGRQSQKCTEQPTCLMPWAALPPSNSSAAATG